MTSLTINSKKWSTPCSLLVGGSSGSGKTTFTSNLIAERMEIFSPPPRHVLYFYKIHQLKYDLMKKTNPEIRFINAPPSSFESFKKLVESYNKECLLVIFDDYEDDMVKNPSLFTRIYTILSHHLNLIPVCLIHNIFRKELRTLSLNVHRMILLKSPRDVSQISHLSRQCFPLTRGYLPSIYNHVMQYSGFPYIVVNFAPHSLDSEHIRVSTRIFKREYPMEVFKEAEKGADKPYEKLVLIEADLYKHLLASSSPITNISQTVNNESTRTDHTSSISSNMEDDTPSLAAPPLIPVVPGRSLGDVRREAEGEQNNSFARVRIQKPSQNNRRDTPHKNKTTADYQSLKRKNNPRDLSSPDPVLKKPKKSSKKQKSENDMSTSEKPKARKSTRSSKEKKKPISYDRIGLIQ